MLVIICSGDWRVVRDCCRLIGGQNACIGWTLTVTVLGANVCKLQQSDEMSIPVRI